MAARRIYVDKTELILLVPTKSKIISHNLIAKDISRIQVAKKESKILGFIKTTDETITIVSGKLSKPIVYKKSEHKAYFEDYKRELEKFAKDNYLNFSEE